MGFVEKCLLSDEYLGVGVSTTATLPSCQHWLNASSVPFPPRSPLCLIPGLLLYFPGYLGSLQYAADKFVAWATRFGVEKTVNNTTSGGHVTLVHLQGTFVFPPFPGGFCRSYARVLA